jgi:hypothetical protein
MNSQYSDDQRVALQAMEVGKHLPEGYDARRLLPRHREKGILYAEIDIEAARRATNSIND